MSNESLNNSQSDLDITLVKALDTLKLRSREIDKNTLDTKVPGKGKQLNIEIDKTKTSSNMTEAATKDEMRDAIKFLTDTFTEKFKEMQQTLAGITVANKASTNNQQNPKKGKGDADNGSDNCQTSDEDEGANETSDSDPPNDSTDDESKEEDVPNQEKKGNKKKTKRRVNNHLARTRQNALAAASNIKEYKQEYYKEFLLEVENIIRIYSNDNASVEIILDTASLKVNNPLVRGKKFKSFKDLKKAVTDIASTELDYRTYSNMIARAAQKSDQTVQHFGNYVAKLFQEQSAAFVRKKEGKLKPKQIQEELEEMSQAAAENFITGINMKNKEVKTRLLNKSYTSLAAAIVESKMIEKSIEDEKARAFAQRSEEFRSKKNFDKEPDQKAVGQKENGKRGKFTGTCYSCNKPGHLSYECPLLKKNDEENKEEDENTPSLKVLPVVTKNLPEPAVSQPDMDEIFQELEFD
jgi:hypothetical protein